LLVIKFWVGIISFQRNFNYLNICNQHTQA
jgi:hypothetical protein